MRVAGKLIKEKITGATIIEQVMPVLLFFWTSWFSYFDTTNTNKAFEAVRFISNDFWCIVFFILGSLGIVTILRDKPMERRYFLFFLSIFWVSWAILLGYTNYTSVGFVTYSVIAFACLLSARKI